MQKTHKCKTAIYNEDVFDESFRKLLPSMGYGSVEYDLKEEGFSARGRFSIDSNKKIESFVCLVEPPDLSDLEVFLLKGRESWGIEVEVNEAWSLRELIGLYRTFRGRVICLHCPVSFSQKNKLLSAWKVFVWTLTLRKLGFEVRSLMGKPSRNESISGGVLYERNFEVLYQSQCSTHDIEFSIIIPVYNSKEFVTKTLQQLDMLTGSVSYEVILCDDGSDDGLRESISVLKEEISYPFKYIYIDRLRKRIMGDYDYRAGLARNIGVGHSLGKYLVFLDSDMLVPENFLETIESEMNVADLVMCQRMHVSVEKSKELPLYGDVQEGDLISVDNGYWLSFYKKGKSWNLMCEKWKYVCTHSLCIKKSLFEKVGGIANNYNIYGYEDVQLGYEVSLVGGVFKLSDNKVYHLSPEKDRSEYSHEQIKRLKLLEKSAKIFYFNTLSESAFEHCNFLWKKNIFWLKFKSIVCYCFFSLYSK